jgi:hypothetical protein
MTLLPAFKDHRHITIDEKPVFILYNPWTHSRVKEWIANWRRMAKEHGLKGLYFVAICDSVLSFKQNADGSRSLSFPNLNSSADIFQSVLDMGFDAINSFGRRRGEMLSKGKYVDLTKTIMRKIGLPIGTYYNYAKTVKGFFAPEDKWENVFPTIMPNWDRSPRAASWDGIYTGATPEAFKKHLQDAIDVVKDKTPEHQVILLKSWNEWGEGNYVEPDQEFGHGYLDAIHEIMFNQ